MLGRKGVRKWLNMVVGSDVYLVGNIFEMWFGVVKRRQWQPTPVLLPGKSHGRRSLGVGSPWGR